MGFLNPDGVLYLWEKAKSFFAPKNAASATENGLMTSADKVKPTSTSTRRIRRRSLASIKLQWTAPAT